MLPKTAQPPQKVSQPVLHGAIFSSLCMPPGGLAAALSANIVMIDKGNSQAQGVNFFCQAI